jgi:predicted phage replisome organizer
MAEVKWIKIVTDMFDSDTKIKQFELLPKGDTIIVIWFKLMLLAGKVNDGGAIYITPNKPFSDKALSGELRRPVGIIKQALTIFEEYGMIRREDEFIYLVSWEKHQNTDRLSELREYNRLAKQRSRHNKNVNDNVNDKSMTSQSCQAIEEDKDKEKDISSLSLDACACEKTLVKLTESERSDLLKRITTDELDYYSDVVERCIRDGKSYTKKTHYQAILDMAMADRKKAPNKTKTKNKQSTSDLERKIIESSRKRVSERIERN